MFNIFLQFCDTLNLDRRFARLFVQHRKATNEKLSDILFATDKSAAITLIRRRAPRQRGK